MFFTLLYFSLYTLPYLASSVDIYFFLCPPLSFLITRLRRQVGTDSRVCFVLRMPYRNAVGVFRPDRGLQSVCECKPRRPAQLFSRPSGIKYERTMQGTAQPDLVPRSTPHTHKYLCTVLVDESAGFDENNIDPCITGQRQRHRRNKTVFTCICWYYQEFSGTRRDSAGLCLLLKYCNLVYFWQYWERHA